MKNDDLFICKDIPKRLSNKEIVLLLNKTKQGDMAAREELIIHNIDLVIQCVKNNFMDTDYDKQELVSVGCIGLIKAIDSYDITKINYYFSIYAWVHITREIKMFLNKINKDKDINYVDIFDNEVKLKPKEISIAEEYEEKDYDNYIYGLLENNMKYLNKRDRKIVMLYCGFYNDKLYSNTEIAEMMNLTRARIWQIIHGKTLLLKNKIIELENTNSNKLKRSKNKKQK